MEHTLDDKKHSVAVYDQYGERIDPKDLRMAPSNPNVEITDEDRFLLRIIGSHIFSLEKFSAKKIKVLYHYTSPSAVRGILCNPNNRHNSALLHFTRFDSLNDRDEQQDIVKFKNKYCREKLELKTFSQSFCDMLNGVTTSNKKMIKIDKNTDETITINEKQYVNDLEFKYLECDVYLCCFSQEDDLLPMWNYYSKSNHYEGYCIGINNKSLQELKFQGNGFGLDVYRVIYSDEEKKKIFDDFLCPLVTLYDNGTPEERRQIKEQIVIFLSDYQYLFKNKAFEHEKEIRAILYVPRGASLKDSKNEYISDVQYRDSHGYIVPYIAFTCPENCVVSVKIAPLLEEELAKRNLSEYLAHMGYEGIDVDSSSIPIRF